MAIHAQSSCTLSTITDVEAVYTYYYLSDSTITVNEAPKDNINPPGASTITVVSSGENYVWQITEPELNVIDNVIQTAVGKLYVIECVKFSDNTYDWGPLMTSSTYAAAKAAYNLSSQALAQATAANNATALLGGHFIYNSTWSTTNTPYSANVVQTILKNGVDKTQVPSEWEHNVHIGSNGISLRYNEAVMAQLAANQSGNNTALRFYKPPTVSGNTTTPGALTMELTGSALNFYGSSTSTPDATLNANGLVLKTGGIIAGEYTGNTTTDFIYASTKNYSTAISIGAGVDKDDWRLIIGSNFGVDSLGNLYATGGRIGSEDSYINITTEGITITGSNLEVDINNLQDTIGIDQWQEEHNIYEETEDTSVVSGKIYYEPRYDYVITVDSTAISGKTYYTRTGDGSADNPYIYTIASLSPGTILTDDTYYEKYLTNTYEEANIEGITNPKTAHLYELVGIENIHNYLNTHFNFDNDGLSIIGNENNYYIKLTTDGMYVYKDMSESQSEEQDDQLVSKFGENIEFSSELPQKIGGENAYIQFTPNNEGGSISIVANSLLIGNTNVDDALKNNEDRLEITEENLKIHSESIDNQQKALDRLTGYVVIDNEHGAITVGNKNSTSNVYIESGNNDNNNTAKVAIRNNNVDVAYMTGDRFFAPSTVVTNLYMKAPNDDGTLIGSLGWVMRNNGHLSLKMIV